MKFAACALQTVPFALTTYQHMTRESYISLLALTTTRCEKSTTNLVDNMDSNYMYLNVTLEFEGSPPDIEETVYMGIVTLALKQLHGDIGAAMMVDLVKYNPDNLQGVFRMQQRDLVKLWSALTLYGYYENQRCAFIVQQDSSDFTPIKEDSKRGELELLSGCG